jgi:type II secretory pathway pseudopilin PulG
VHLAFDFWSIVAAAETAAWRLKWVALPVAPPALWSALRVCASLRRERERFNGLRFAHSGLAVSGLVVLMFATCIGVTIPERMRQQQRSLEAAQEARLDTFNRALLEYRLRYKTLPTDLNELKDKLPDPDKSITAVLADLDPASEYHPGTLVASLPPKKSRSMRGAAIRPVSASMDDSPGEGVMFTDYELRLPGEDKILGTEDDWVLRNGVVTKPSPSAAQTMGAGSSNNSTAP